MKLPRLDRAETALVLLMVLTLPLVNPYVRSDGNGYYAYVRSAALDGDLHFDNEYRRGDPEFVSASFRRSDGQPWPPMNTRSGHLRNQWAVGPSLLWVPSFVQAHLLVRAANLLGADIAADGYSAPYRWLTAIATALYAFLGLLLAYRTAARTTSPAAALVATVTVWFATSLPMYMYFLPFHVHALASFAVALFLWYWLRARPLRGALAWAAWGALGGLMVVVYHLNVAFLAAAGLEWLHGAADRSRPRRQVVAESLRNGALFGLGALVAAAPHFAAKWIVHGSPFDTGRLNRFFWTMPGWTDVGFASDHGLFLWTPVALLALLGLGLFLRQARLVAASLLVAFAFFYYVVASYDRWHGVSGFGNRFFVSFTFPFVLGLAVLLARLERALRATSPRRAFAAMAVPAALLIAWNLGLMVQWATGLVPRRGPVDFRQAVRNQFTAVPQQAARVGLRYFGSRSAVVKEQEKNSLQN